MLAAVKSAGKALRRSKHQLPASRRAELEDLLAQYFEADTCTEAHVKAACAVEPRCVSDNWACHAATVVERVVADGGARAEHSSSANGWFASPPHGLCSSSTVFGVNDSRAGHVTDMASACSNTDSINGSDAASDAAPAAAAANGAVSQQGVVEQPADEAAIEEFVRGWRRHFLAVMQPRFLPPYWDVYARATNSSAKEAAAAKAAKLARRAVAEGPQ